MRRGLIMLLAAALVLTGALPAEAAKRNAPKGFYGVDVEPRRRGGARGAARRRVRPHGPLRGGDGAHRVRLVGRPARAGGRPSFTDTDRLVTLAAAHRIDLLPVVIYTPGWAAEYPGKSGSPPRAPSDYAAYLTALVGRYGPKGSFWAEHPELPKVPIRRWQIWNEPHLVKYWYVEGATRLVPGYPRS